MFANILQTGAYPKRHTPSMFNCGRAKAEPHVFSLHPKETKATTQRESTALETPAGSSLCSLKTGIGCDGSMKCGFPGFWKPGNEVLARSRAGPGCCEQGRNRRKAEIGLEEGCTVGEKASAENSIKKGKSSKKKKN